MHDDIYKNSLEAHKNHRGKIEIKNKMPLDNMHDLAIAYSPGVAAISRKIAEDPKSVREYTIKGNTIAVVSDGSAILGLGNLGPLAAIPVMEGKAALFKKFANIDAFPICLDTQDEDKIVETIKNIVPMFGAINLEDISAPRCFAIEDRLRKEINIPIMHDDQHGTAVVVLAGLINALKLRGSDKAQVRVVFSGAGAAGTAIVDLLFEYGFKNIIVNDSKGAIYEGREDLNSEKIKLAKITNKEIVKGGLGDTLKGADIFVGVSKAGVLTPLMIQSMAKDPIIFALANPEPEIMPEEAKKAGAFVVATGRSDYPNQVNNALAFPGIFRGALDNKIKQFNNKMFVKAAEVIAGGTIDMSVDKIVPNIFESGMVEKIRDVIRE